MKQTKTQSKWSTDAEMMMMGFVIPLQGHDHMIHLLDYVKKTLKQDYDSEEIITNSQQFLTKEDDGSFDDTKYKHMCLNNTEFGLMITITIDDPDEESPNEEYSLTSPDGVFSYVYNVDTPYFSELGYTFFQNKGGKIVRVG